MSFTDDISTECRKYFILTIATLVAAFGLNKIIAYAVRLKYRRLLNRNAVTRKAALTTTLEERKPSYLWNTAMFFPDYHADEPDSTTQQFLWYFQQARTSIRVCIYNISFPELEFVLCEQYKRGLIVQLIVGHEISAEKLRKESVPCGVYPKHPNLSDTDQLMHHKFALIDDEAVIVGSMNWTTEGILNNNENICVSTNQAHVEKYLVEYFRLMRMCEEAKTFY